MTEPASHAGFRDLARQALSPRTGIPAKTDWEVFLHGFASTNQLGGEKERDIYECLLRTFPTPESVLEQDLRTLRNEEGCQNLISPVNSADWMKQNAANWESIAPLLRCRTRAEQAAIRNFIDDPQNQNKRLKNQVKGAGFKGSDMTLLWGGCNVPVIDKQLIRYLAPHMLGTDWDSYIRDQLSQRKYEGHKLIIGRRFAAELGETIDAEDIDVDNSNHRYAEEEAIVGKIQSTVGRYGAWRDLAYQMADAEGIPANVWHVATWLEYRIGGDPDSPRANPRTLARGREFADRTYAPSQTPGAWLDHRNDEVEAAIARGRAGTDKLIKDPRTGEMIDEGEAIFRLHWDPEEGPNILPGDPAWFSFARRQSAEAQDIEDATVKLQEIMYTIDSHVRQGDMTFDEMDEETQSQYELFWRDHVNPTPGKPLYGEETGEMGGRIYNTLVKRNALPRQLRTYAGLAGLVDKMDSIRHELMNEDLEMLKAIMEGEERAIAIGTGRTPDAWYDHHPENRQALIEDGGGYDIIDPVSGQTIHLAEAENSLNYLPPALSRAAPWDDDWFRRSGPQSQDARFLRQVSDDVTDMIHELEFHLMKDDPPLGPEMDRLARRNYNEWRRDHRAYGWPYVPRDAQITTDLLPDKIDSLTQLYQVEEKLAQHKMSLQNADMQMLTAIAQAEEEAIQRGWLKGQITPGAYDPELVDRINANIDQMVSYGLRTEVATGYPSYVLSWSNAGARWGIYARIRKKGEEVTLDANQILVQASRPAIEETLPLLHMLPLFSQSFEYRYRPPTQEEDDLTPSAELGVFYTPEHYDPNIQEYHFYEYGPLDEDDSPYIDAYEHWGTEVSGEGELLDDSVIHHEDFGKAEFLSGETSKSSATWDIDDVKVQIDYGPWTSRLGEHIDHAAWVSIERYGGAPFDNSMFLPDGPIAKVTDLLDRIHRSNPNLRIVATATRDSEGRGDLRARVYERYGWRRISQTDPSGGVDMELLHPDQRPPRTPTAFDGIDGYANAIMELV